MNEKVVVTAGAKGADIDVLACVVAYAELLKLEGKESVAVVAGDFTASVTPTVLEWEPKYEKTYVPEGNESYVLVDISDPEHFPAFVDHNVITEVYDHRYGHEEYWKEKLGSGFHIEMVGSCGTLIWEEFKKRGKAEDISQCAARLLLASIVSNNMNFKSSLTTSKDRNAYSELQRLADLQDNWVKAYFLEQEKILLEDLEMYLDTDTKVFKIGENNFAIGQIELWDAGSIIKDRRQEIDNVMNKYDDMSWVVNISDVSHGYNYIYSTSERGKKAIEEKLQITFEDNIAKTNELVMRKQLMKLLRE